MVVLVFPITEPIETQLGDTVTVDASFDIQNQPVSSIATNPESLQFQSSANVSVVMYQHVDGQELPQAVYVCSNGPDPDLPMPPVSVRLTPTKTLLVFLSDKLDSRMGFSKSDIESNLHYEHDYSQAPFTTLTLAQAGTWSRKLDSGLNKTSMEAPVE